VTIADACAVTLIHGDETESEEDYADLPALADGDGSSDASSDYDGWQNPARWKSSTLRR
jgi:hypothetical protein